MRMTECKRRLTENLSVDPNWYKVAAPDLCPVGVQRVPESVILRIFFWRYLFGQLAYLQVGINDAVIGGDTRKISFGSRTV